MPTSKQLAELIKRRHPEYEKMSDHWSFLNATYIGGREWFKDNIYRYHKEGPTEYEDRVERAYRFNHTREVVHLVHKYLFKELISRPDDVPKEVSDFWDCATLDHESVNELMRQADILSSVSGRIWVVCDSTADGETVTVSDEKHNDSRPYAYIITPEQMLDFAYDKQGNLLWCLIAETARDDQDPLESTGKTSVQYRLWTQEDWYLIAEVKGRGKKYEIVDQGNHDLGLVPAFPIDCFNTSSNKYTSPALIDDIAYLDRAVANYLSNLDAIIQDQTFSQLAIPVQGLMPGDDDHKKVLDMGTNRIFTFDGEGGAKPFYMSPDPKQAHVILSTVSKIINEIYSSVGVAAERTKEDNSQGIDNSSGVAKAYDFQRVHSLLVNKAESLQKAEAKLMQLVLAWQGKETPLHECNYAKYPESFDVRGLSEEFAIAEQLALLQAPESLRQEQMKLLIDKIFPVLEDKVQKKIDSELLKFPPKDDLTLESKSLVTYNKDTAKSSSSDKPTQGTESPKKN